MAAFNSTSATTQSSFYSLRGEVLETKDVKFDGKGNEEGEMKCFCFGVKHVNGIGMYFCLLAGGGGEVMERKANFNGNVAVGLQQPQNQGGRTLPTCEELKALESEETAGDGGSGSGGFYKIFALLFVF
jgi:hypothetical protein